MQRFYPIVSLLVSFLSLHTGLAQDIDNPNAGPVVVRKVTKAITPANYAGRQVMVGSGGGVTGASTTYYLLENGQLFGRRSRDSVYKFIGKQTTTTTKRIFARAEGTCKIKTTQFDNPGNRYQFVSWRKGKQTYKVTWGEPGTTPPASYPPFYKTFMTLIPLAKRL